jgi:hypothetical protein
MCSTRRASRFVPGCGRRSQAPSVIPRSTKPNGPVADGTGAPHLSPRDTTPRGTGHVPRDPELGRRVGQLVPKRESPTPSSTAPLDLVGRGMTDGACERRPHPGTSRSARVDEHVERGGCESSAYGADRIHDDWCDGPWPLRKAPAALFRIGTTTRDGTLLRVPRYCCFGA